LISAGDVDRTFNAAVIRELAAFFPANADLTQLAPNIRDAARQFIQAKGHLSAPQIRAEIKRLYSLTNRGLRDDLAARQLARAISYMNADVREWLIRCNPPGREIPSVKEVENTKTRPDAINKLRVILSYGGKLKQGRKRPSGKHSRSMDPLLRVVPTVKKKGREAP
jgi:hypothetical protein